jgi:pyruvate carboxylase subunit B
MAGLMAPYDAYALVRALKETLSVPIHLHSHFTSGMADMSLLKAIEAGVDIVDTCLSTWAYRTSHPAVEPLVATLRHTSRDTGLDIELLAKLSGHLEKISPRYRHLLDERTSPIDINVLLHQTPGGMLSNLVNQLKEMDALDRLDEVFRQLPIVRRELGQVPLVTPTSQIVGIQTVNNVLFDTPSERYRMITEQVKDLCYGLYGRTAVPIDPEVRAKALKGYPRGEEPITGRPADVLGPELDKAREDTDGLARDLDDVLVCALYPTTGKRFLRWKYGLEEMPAEVKGSEDPAGKTVKPPGEKGPEARTFRVRMNGNSFEVDVEQIGGKPLFASEQPPGRKPTLDLGRKPARGSLTHSPPGPARQERLAAAAPQGDTTSETPVLTPMPGMVVCYRVHEGDRVKQGDVVAVLEAMKMENYITAPVDGTVRRITLGEGANAKKGEVLALIA